MPEKCYRHLLSPAVQSIQNKEECGNELLRKQGDGTGPRANPRYYNTGGEKDRLTRGIGVIEWERSKVIISRYLSGNKQVIYDVGGGTGVYSRWPAELGHEVHLLELSPAAVEYARNLQQEENTFPLHSIEVADARQLLRPDESADLVLLMGPLYHLTAREERIAAIREAARVLKPGRS